MSPVRRPSRPEGMTRRQFALAAGSALAAVAGAGCARSPGADGLAARLDARPLDHRPAVAAGERALGLDARRDATLQVPSRAVHGPVPLLVLLHGAGGSGRDQLHRFGSAGAETGVAVLAPDSRGPTWDAIRGRFGPDVTFLNRALARTFETMAVDPARVAIGGFSDGATYALSLGLMNGDLFTRVVAFSPGFLIDGTATGRPRVFVSHGRTDDILPIDRCSRRIVPALSKRGYDVVFREFDGGHLVPPDVIAAGFAWVAG